MQMDVGKRRKKGKSGQNNQWPTGSKRNTSEPPTRKNVDLYAVSRLGTHDGAG